MTEMTVTDALAWADDLHEWQEMYGTKEIFDHDRHIDTLAAEVRRLQEENKAQLEELTSISDALETNEGHTSVYHIFELREQIGNWKLEERTARLRAEAAEALAETATTELECANQLIEKLEAEIAALRKVVKDVADGGGFIGTAAKDLLSEYQGRE